MWKNLESSVIIELVQKHWIFKRSIKHTSSPVFFLLAVRSIERTAVHAKEYKFTHSVASIQINFIIVEIYLFIGQNQ